MSKRKFHNFKKKERDQFTPTIEQSNFDLKAFSIDVIDEKMSLDVLLSTSLNEMTAWFESVLRRKHWQWASKKLEEEWKPKLIPVIEEKGITSAEVLEILKGLQVITQKAMVDYAKEVILKIQTTIEKKKQEFREKKEAAKAAKKSKNQAKEFSEEKRAEFLSLTAVECLKRLLSETGPLNNKDLGEVFAKEMKTGFVAHYGSKINHVLNSTTDFAKNSDKTWGLATTSTADTDMQIEQKESSSSSENVPMKPVS